MAETEHILKKVQFPDSDELWDIGAKYDDQNNLITDTYAKINYVDDTCDTKLNKDLEKNEHPTGDIYVYADVDGIHQKVPYNSGSVISKITTVPVEIIKID